MALRLLRSGNSSAAFNMTADAFLFAQYKKKRQAVLRFYRWQHNCISLGRNQKLEETLYLDRCQADNLELVRRVTGGQAIFHQRNELSYSLVASLGDIQASCKVKDAYQKICSNLIRAYAELGLKAEFAATLKSQFKGKNNLCYASWEDDDIIIADRKIGGNAQRRSRDIVLQHGSIPLSFDAALVKKYVRDVPEDIAQRTVALNELMSSPIELDELERVFLDAFKENLELYEEKLDDYELDEIDRRLDETRLA